LEVEALFGGAKSTKALLRGDGTEFRRTPRDSVPHVNWGFVWRLVRLCYGEYHEWCAAAFFRWDISVICPVIILKIAVTALLAYLFGH